jgi:Zn-dependent protease with chaperone function
MARAVAAKVDTRPVDEIWLTPGTDLAVFERGSKRARMSDRARRALLLGAGVLDGFGQTAFQAVLAHEYGHFSHRDTAGGDVALRVQNGMYKFAIALAEAGYAVWWNMAFQFLRIYNFIFRRISHGATRLQEVLADRVAIQRFGFDAFKQGLTHVIRKSVVFSHTLNLEINDAIECQRPLANLYALPEPKSGDTAASISQDFAAALGQSTTEDDTHPSPKDRFRLGERIAGAAPDLSSGVVWDLFEDPEGLMTELTADVAERVTEGSGVNVTAFQS